MIIQGHKLHIDILEELDPYLDRFPLYTIRESKLISCSPFRSENRPSFALHLEHGGFIDSGSTDPLYSKGNFIRLLSFIMNTTECEVEQYLLEKYYINLDQTNYKLSLNLVKEECEFDLTELNNLYAYRHPYLASRGISELVQQHFQIGYDKNTNSVTMPWHNTKGTIVNIKYRNIQKKNFFFVEGGSPIKYHVYGMHMVLKYNKTKIVIVESEIDALYLWSLKIPAVALGGSNISIHQIKILLASNVDTIVLGTDTDEQGRKIRNKLFITFAQYFRVFNLDIPQEYKDVNEIPPNLLLELYNNTSNYEWEIIKTN